MVYLRIQLALLSLCFTGILCAQSAPLPDAPSAILAATASSAPATDTLSSSVVAPQPLSDTYLLASLDPGDILQTPEIQTPPPATDPYHGDNGKPTQTEYLDANGKPIPLERRQPQRILGFMPNFRSVSGGSTPHAPGWKYNFKIATRQSFDYSSFIFLGITSLSAEGINSHPVLGKGADGFWAYTWRGFLDKTDGTYLGGWLLPSLLHEDTRFYALGNGHSIPVRALYVISRQGVARTYGGHQTPNIAGLGGKVLTQVVSRNYYPTGATSFSVLATKFAYAAMRDIAFSSVREFYPDIAAHYIKKHREKLARQAAADAASSHIAP